MAADNDKCGGCGNYDWDCTCSIPEECTCAEDVDVCTCGALKKEKQLEEERHGDYLYGKRSFAQGKINGDVGEKWYENKLIREGYKVVRSKCRTPEGRHLINEKYLNAFFENNNISGLKVLKDIKKNLCGCPDFLCIKEDMLSFIEVKSNKGCLNPKQKESIKKLREMGYVVDVIYLEVEIKVKEKKLQKTLF